MNAAKVYGGFSVMKNKCQSFQRAYEVFVDYMFAVMRQGGVRVSTSNSCKNAMYDAPKNHLKYLMVWMTMDESKILKATFKILKTDRNSQVACFGRSRHTPSEFTNYQACVKNVVHLFYQDIKIDREVGQNTMNTAQVTQNIKDYLKSALAAKYNCATRGHAMKMKFANQN